MPTFNASNIPDLTGKTAIVTGAGSGLGQEAARALAAAGARVVYAVRNTDKGEKAAAGAGNTEVRRLDLGSLESIRGFALGWEGDIDLLICNAGVVMPPSLTRTSDGFETQFGVNHLGHYALARLLLGHITGRVVSVSANAHRFGKIDFDDLNWEHRRYNPTRSYAQSKLATLLFTVELQRRLTAAGSGVLAVAAHPGAAATEAITNSGGTENLMFRMINRTIAQSPAEGALELLYAAVADIPGGTYIGPGGFMQMRGAPTTAKPSKAVQDADLARRLWAVSAQLTNTQPALTLG